LIFVLDLAVLTTLTLLWIVIVPTPGANSLMVTHVALTRGSRHVVLALAGNMLGILLLASCALFGMAYVLEAFPWLRLTVHVLGGVYLVYFGLRLIRQSRRPAPIPEPLQQESVTDRSTQWRAFVLGFLTAVSNAQAIVFITSIFAASGVLKANLATGLACIVIMLICNASYLAFLAWLFMRSAARQIYQRFHRILEATIGGLFVLFGARLAFRELASR
jgi:threonine efflux protein